jgi:predicted transcriptional regulator
LDGAYNEYLPICTHIREEIRNNQIIGGLLGVYNPSITQRLNNLVERSEIDHKGEIKNTYDLSKVSTDTLKELLNAATTDKPSEGGNM